MMMQTARSSQGPGREITQPRINLIEGQCTMVSGWLVGEHPCIPFIISSPGAHGLILPSRLNI